MIRALRHHWPEYLMEAAGLGIFMVSAVVFATTLEHPSSPIRQAIDDPLLRRTLMGIAMGVTAIGIIYSPWGQQSGAHINPAITLTFLRLGKIERWDAFFYVGAQFVGGAAGVMLATLPLREWVGDPSVNYVATVPGSAGTTVAFVAELVMSFILMTAVLITSNSRRLSRLTGLFAGVLVATYHHVRSSLLRHEHQPRAHRGLSAARSTMDRALAIFHRPSPGHVARSRGVPAIAWGGTRALRKTQPPHW